MYARAFSFSPDTSYHRHDITEILLLWHKTRTNKQSICISSISKNEIASSHLTYAQNLNFHPNMTSVIIWKVFIFGFPINMSGFREWPTYKHCVNGQALCLLWLTYQSIVLTLRLWLFLGNNRDLWLLSNHYFPTDIAICIHWLFHKHTELRLRGTTS